MSRFGTGMSREHLHIQIWYLTKFYQTVVLAHEKVPLWSGPKSEPNIWSGLWSNKDLVWTKLVCVEAVNS